MIGNIKCKDINLFVCDKKTNEIIELGRVNEFELIEENEIYNSYNQDNGIIHQGMTASIKYSTKKLKKKKFIKLLMSRKIQRNAANELANYFHNKRGYYSYIDLILLDGGIR